MAPRSDRRRKRPAPPPPPPSEAAPSSSSSSSSSSPTLVSRLLPLAVLVAFALLLIHVSFEDAPTGSTGAALSSAGRRFLVGMGEEDPPAAPDENVWQRQLRTRKDRERREGGGRRMGLSMKDDKGVVDDEPPPSRSMKVIMTQEETWPAYEGKHRFEECVGKSIGQCQTLVDFYVSANPEQFNNQTTLWLDVRKIREITDPSYYKVVIRTDMNAQFVAGIFNDGMVYYPWTWTVEERVLDVGPWDCQGKTAEACCFMIQEDVPYPNDAGDFMACFVEYPVGTVPNPEMTDRAITVVSPEGKVLRAPIAH